MLLNTLLKTNFQVPFLVQKPDFFLNDYKLYKYTLFIYGKCLKTLVLLIL